MDTFYLEKFLGNDAKLLHFIVHNNCIYVSDHFGHLYIFDCENGILVHQFVCPDSRRPSSLCIFNNHLVIGDCTNRQVQLFV